MFLWNRGDRKRDGERGHPRLGEKEETSHNTHCHRTLTNTKESHSHITRTAHGHITITDTSSHSPVPVHQTRCSVSPLAPCKTDSIVSEHISTHHPMYHHHHLTLINNSHTSIKNPRIPSSFLPSCSSTNFTSVTHIPKISVY